MAFRITSPAFVDGAAIPARHTCDGQDRSPLLTWSDAPDGTASFTLIVDDPDAPSGTFTHWILYDIPRYTTELAENVPEGTFGSTGRNSFGRIGYGGLCPLAGETHRYRFTLYAIDRSFLELGPHIDREDVEAAMAGHVLHTAQLEGTYQRATRARRTGA